MKTEHRTIDAYQVTEPLPPLELRAAEGDKPARLSGYAIVFDTLSCDLGGFREVIKPGAAKATIESGRDIRALVDHDHTKILGRTSAATLKLGEGTRGVWADIDLPNTTYANDLLESVKRKDIRGMSFGFHVPEGGDTWAEQADGSILRTVSNLELVEVTCTSIPAYTATSLAVRAEPEIVAKAQAMVEARRARPELQRRWMQFRRLVIG